MRFGSSQLKIWKSIVRSFFIQGSWHYQGMLNLGFLFALVPFLRDTKDTPVQKETLNRHRGYFNTHPFMASYIIGAIAKMEEDILFQHKGTDATIIQLKNILSRTLGAVGDRLFWKFLRPFSMIIGMVIIFYLKPFFPYNIIIGITTSFLIFNSYHFWHQIHGMFLGYKFGAILPLHLNIRQIEQPISWIQVSGLAGLGLLCWAEGLESYTLGMPGVVAFVLAVFNGWWFQDTKLISPSLSFIFPILIGFTGGIVWLLLERL
ncbi:MAG: PTS system mannose/fructose/sorbose family transporter subunit IID [Patescibacteria group bacterium]|nr:PTS system mannose/fructose/sorbose family transporter subunit IID [Patescibacteria group bacterium]